MMKKSYLQFFDNELMKYASLVVMAMLLQIAALSAQDLAPTNDNLANAQLLSSAATSVTGTNVAATKESGEPAHADNKGGASVWFRYESQVNGVITLNTFGSAFNTTMAVYTGTSMSNLNWVASNDDLAEDNTFAISSRIRLGVTAGKTYYIAIDGRNGGSGAATGNITLHYALQNSSTNDSFSSATAIFGTYGRQHSTSNVGASKELGEPNHFSNSGGRSVWYKWKSPAGERPTSYTFEVRSRSAEGEGSFLNMIAVYTGTSVSQLTAVRGNSRSFLNRVTFRAEPATEYYIALDGWDSGTGASNGSLTLSFGPTKARKNPDADRDGKTDLAVYRPTTGTWYILESATETMEAFQWGSNGDKPLVGDFSPPDGRIDHTVYRPDTGVWYTNRAASGNFVAFPFGIATDIPMLRLDEHQLSNRPTVYRQETGTFWSRNSDGTAETVQWGQQGDIPIIADFNGDSVETFAVFRPSTGIWYHRYNNSGGFEAIAFGQQGDRPVPADYDGDGLIDLAVYRPSTGVWWIRRTTDGVWSATQFGLSNDIPQPSDYDGDGKDDIAVFRNGTWWILNSSNGSVRTVQWGMTGDVPIASPYGLMQ